MLGENNARKVENLTQFKRVQHNVWSFGGRNHPKAYTMTSTFDDVQLISSAVPADQFDELTRVFPRSHFEKLIAEKFPFYRTTFWFPLDRGPENIFESITRNLFGLANPSPGIIGVEWWFSVLQTNATPQWLLRCHFDRNDLTEKDIGRLTHPNKGSVLFLNAVPYGELVITDQVLSSKGKRPRQPKEMRFIRPDRNLYAVFPGHLCHGVIGRMWRPQEENQLRVSMAVNYWTEKPKADYLKDSAECMGAFRLPAPGSR